MNKKLTKKILLIIAIVLFCLVTGFTIYNWFLFQKIDAGQVLVCFFVLAILFHILAWGDKEDIEQSDELASHIKTRSSEVGYFALMIISSIILFVSEGTGDFSEINNYPLLFVVGFSFVIRPLTQFIYSQKFK